VITIAADDLPALWEEFKEVREKSDKEIAELYGVDVIPQPDNLQEKIEWIKEWLFGSEEDNL